MLNISRINEWNNEQKDSGMKPGGSLFKRYFLFFEGKDIFFNDKFRALCMRTGLVQVRAFTQSEEWKQFVLILWCMDQDGTCLTHWPILKQNELVVLKYEEHWKTKTGIRELTQKEEEEPLR